MWLKLGQNRRSPVKNQFTHSDSSSIADEKWSKNDDDLMHPDRVIASQSSNKVLISAFLIILHCNNSVKARSHDPILGSENWKLVFRRSDFKVPFLW